MQRIITLTLLLCLGVLSAQAAEQKPHFRVEVAEPYINIRTGPGKAYPVFYVGQRGQQLTTLKRRGLWYKVEMPTTGERTIVGWTHRDDLGNTLVAGTEMLARDHERMNFAYTPRFEASFLLGRMKGEGDSDSLAGILSYRLTPMIDTELQLGKWIGNTEEGWYTNGQLTYLPFRDWWVKPFVAVGYGYLARDARGTNILQFDNSDHFLLAGSGLKIRITSQYGLRLEYRHLNTLTTKDDNSELEQWQVGLSATF